MRLVRVGPHATGVRRDLSPSLDGCPVVAYHDIGTSKAPTPNMSHERLRMNLRDVPYVCCVVSCDHGSQPDRQGSAGETPLIMGNSTKNRPCPSGGPGVHWCGDAYSSFFTKSYYDLVRSPT